MILIDFLGVTAGRQQYYNQTKETSGKADFNSLMFGICINIEYIKLKYADLISH